MKRPDKGLLLRYLRIVSGYSRQQVTRLVAQFVDTGKIERHYRAPLAGFACKYATIRFQWFDFLQRLL